MLAARSGVATSIETEIRLRSARTGQKAGQDRQRPTGRSKPNRNGADGEIVLTVKLREAGKGAAAKLAYLLGLNPCCEFQIADGKLVPISLGVDTKQPVQKLVEQALTTGPGVRELEGLLRAVEDAQRQLRLNALAAECRGQHDGRGLPRFPDWPAV